MPSRRFSTSSASASRCAVRGEIDLGHVAVHHHFRVEALAREDHFHLLGRGVLGLVQDDEAVVQGAAAHERQRRDLDGVALQQLLHFSRLQHVVERVVQRPEVGIDLLL